MARFINSDGVAVYVLEGAEETKLEDVSLAEFHTPSRVTDCLSHELIFPDGTKELILPEQCLRSFPNSVRYDTLGNELYAELTQHEEDYYCAFCEREILKTQMDSIADHIPDGAAIVELGCGSMTKTSIILDYLRTIAGKRGIRFYALDIDRMFLERSLRNLRADEAKKSVPDEHAVRYAGIHGTYDQAIPFLKEISGPRALLWMGTSMGNMTRSEASDLLGRYAKVMDEQDMFFIGIDKRKDPKIVAKAYNDRLGIGSKLGMNTLARLNTLFGYNAFDLDKFTRVAGYNEELGQIEMYIKSRVDQTVTIPSAVSSLANSNISVFLKENEYIHYSYSVKYSKEDLLQLAASAGMELTDIWTDTREMFHFCMFKKTAAEE